MPSTSNCGQQKTGAIHYSNANVVAHYMKRSVTLSCRTFMFNTILAYLIEVQDERRTGEREDRSEGRKKTKETKISTRSGRYIKVSGRQVCVYEKKLVFVFGRQFSGDHSQLNIVQFDSNAQSELLCGIGSEYWKNREDFALVCWTSSERSEKFREIHWLNVFELRNWELCAIRLFHLWHFLFLTCAKMTLYAKIVQIILICYAWCVA